LNNIQRFATAEEALRRSERQQRQTALQLEIERARLIQAQTGPGAHNQSNAFKIYRTAGRPLRASSRPTNVCRIHKTLRVTPAMESNLPETYRSPDPWTGSGNQILEHAMRFVLNNLTWF
jgi:hypothetical protein